MKIPQKRKFNGQKIHRLIAPPGDSEKDVIQRYDELGMSSMYMRLSDNVKEGEKEEYYEGLWAYECKHDCSTCKLLRA